VPGSPGSTLAGTFGGAVRPSGLITALLRNDHHRPVGGIRKSVRNRNKHSANVEVGLAGHTQKLSTDKQGERQFWWPVCVTTECSIFSQQEWLCGMAPDGDMPTDRQSLRDCD
jgi:hypothetical protein